MSTVGNVAAKNWNKRFAIEFQKRRGYNLMPYLPLLAGIPMESVEQSEKILRDVRTTISELVVDVFYQVLADCAREYDLPVFGRMCSSDDGKRWSTTLSKSRSSDG